METRIVIIIEQIEIIKIVLGIFVLVIIIITAYMGVGYIKDYFSGYNFNESSHIGKGFEGSNVCLEKNGKKIIGSLYDDGKYLILYYKDKKGTQKKSGFYIKKDDAEVIKWDRRGPDWWSEGGRINNGIQIEIYNDYLNKKFAKEFNNAYIGGLEICK